VTRERRSIACSKQQRFAIGGSPALATYSARQVLVIRPEENARSVSKIRNASIVRIFSVYWRQEISCYQVLAAFEGMITARYQVHLLEELEVGTVANHVGALRFLYVRVLKRRELKEDLPCPHYPKQKRRLPVILSQEEVSRLLDSAKNLFHYAILLTMYSAGLRRSELCRLKVSHIDSQRMMLRIERGKGDVDREVPLNQKLLQTLRDYWRWIRPKNYLVSGHGQRLASRQADYRQGDLGSRAIGGQTGRNRKARYSPYLETLLRYSSAPSDYVCEW
jgi:integrase